MSSSSHSNEHGEHGDGQLHVHIEPMPLYLAVFGSLIVMTVVTVGASYIDFGSANTAIAVVIATVKATLVAYFFMHLRHDKPFNALVFVGGLFFLSFLFLFTLLDTGSRNNVDDFHGKSTAAKVKWVKPTHSAGAAGHGEEKKHLDFSPVDETSASS